MKRSLLSVLAAAAVACPVSGTDIMGSLVFNTALPSIEGLSNNAKVVIGPAAAEQAFLRQDGTFVIQDVKPGSYVLEVQSVSHLFNRFRIDVPSSDSSVPIVTPYDHRYSRSPPLSPSESPLARGEQALGYPIQLVPQGKVQYEVKQEGFKPLKMVMSNPLYLIMGGMVVMMMVMPKLVGMLDPEALEEMQRNQAAMHKSMSDFQSGDFSKGFSGLLGDSSTSSKAAEQASANDKAPAKAVAQGSSTGVRPVGQGNKRKK